jgi:hypothetical protein
MSDLTRHVDDYLRLRWSFGFNFAWPGHLLHQLDVYREAAGATTLTAAVIIDWARLPQGVQPLDWAHRFSDISVGWAAAGLRGARLRGCYTR